MKARTKILLILIVIFLATLAWAPWLNNKAIHDKVFATRAKIDGTIDRQTGELICDYTVGWLPFGRWVGSCEGGYFVTFWGKII